MQPEYERGANFDGVGEAESVWHLGIKRLEEASDSSVQDQKFRNNLLLHGPPRLFIRNEESASPVTALHDCEGTQTFDKEGKVAPNLGLKIPPLRSCPDEKLRRLSRRRSLVSA